jgi:pimeloyl-ACP methyl ester carboxylesterase
MRIVGRILKWLGLGLFALIGSGAVYQQVGSLVDDATVPRMGRLVAVNGHNVLVNCTGQGKRTLVLDAGLGAASFEWFRLQPLLAANNRVCSFDRPGQGASDAIDHAYDGATAADELYAMTAAAGIATPFVYVGHSLGANFAQICAARYPGDIEALVLIEPGVPTDILEDFHGTRAEALAMPATCGGLCIAGWIAGGLGVSRFVINHVYTGASSFDHQQVAIGQYHASAARAAMPGVSAAYYAALPKIAWQVNDAAPPRTIPVLVLASAIAPPPDGGETAADMVKWRKRQLTWFSGLASHSVHGAGPITIAGSTHASMVMGAPARQTARIIEAFLAGLRSAATTGGNRS